jgi:hypothetical protein
MSDHRDYRSVSHPFLIARQAVLASRGGGSAVGRVTSRGGRHFVTNPIMAAARDRNAQAWLEEDNLDL